MPYIWLGITVFMAIVEAITSQLVSIWFVLGGISALVVSLFSDSIVWQCIAFAFVSVLSLVVTRPIIKRLLNFKKDETNLERYIGKKCIVTSKIDNSKGYGRVNLMGLSWTAKSLTGEIIDIDETVQVVSIEGVKLIVTR